MSVDRLSTAFHETFPLNLPSISAILRLACDTNGQLTSAIIRENTSLGTRYVKSMPRYARGCGLLEMGTFQPTHFGKLVCNHDPNLSHPATLWMMHYHLCAPHGPGPAYWYNLIAHCLPFYEDVSDAAMTSATARLLEAEQPGDALQPDTIKAAVTVFRRTYARTDGLGRLGFLQESKQKGSIYVYVSAPQLPPPGVVAYALADYWAGQPYAFQKTVSLSEFARDDGFARLMWMDPHNLEETLDILRRDGVLELFRTAPPYQVSRLWSCKEDLLARLYD